MNYNSIILIKDNEVYINNNNKILTLTLKSHILNNGIIINEELFCKEYIKFLKLNKITTFFWNKKIVVIYDSCQSKNDVKIIFNVFSSLNYRNITLTSDSGLIKYNKQDNFLITGKRIKLYFIDSFNTKQILVIDPQYLKSKEIKNIIESRSKNKNLYVVGENKHFKFDEKTNYYVFNSIPEFFFKFYLSEI